ncbi:MAG TPA: hypothetical protein EYG18_00680, partial [Micavibrio sp.]|nr:hypothetical protein [Micavibrio sp.]
MEIQEQKARFEEFKESYSDDFLDECLNDLKVSPKDRTNMKAALIGAGRTYILFDNLSNMYVPAREMRAKYDAIYKPLKKLKDTWLAVWENDAFDFCTLFTHAELQYSPNEKSYEANQLIKDFMRHETQNFHLAYGELIHFLDFLD